MAKNHEDRELYRVTFCNNGSVVNRWDVLANSIVEAIEIARADLTKGEVGDFTKVEQISDGWILQKP